LSFGSCHGLKRSRVRSALSGWLVFREGMFVPEKRKGRDLLTPLHRHGHALQGTLSGTPVLGVPSSAVLEVEIVRFVEDSSRSYAKFVLLNII
jgi:hypothetical protein